MIRRLREESVLERSSYLVERGAPARKAFQSRLVKRLRRSHLAGLEVEAEFVRVGSWFDPAKTCVHVGTALQRDLHCYIEAETAGVHLRITRSIALEPPLLKRWLAAAIFRGAWWRWSLPNGTGPNDVAATFLGIVDACVNDVMRECATKAAAAADEL